MKKSEIFTRKYPSPTDVYLYPRYKSFVAYQQEVAQNWREEMLSGMVGMRNFLDLRDVRLSVKHLDEEKGPAIVVSLKPVVGVEITEQMAFYLHLFRSYRSLIREIYERIVEYRDRPSDYPAPLLQAHKYEIHKAIAIVRVLLMAANHDVLTRDHLDLIDKRSIDQINAMVKGLGFAEFFDHKVDHPASFWHDTDQELVDAFWKWVDRKASLGMEKASC